MEGVTGGSFRYYDLAVMSRARLPLRHAGLFCCIKTLTMGGGRRAQHFPPHYPEIIILCNSFFLIEYIL